MITLAFQKEFFSPVTRKRRKLEILETWWLKSIQEIPWTMGSSRENKENRKGHRDGQEGDLTDCGSCDTTGSGWWSELSLPSPDLMSLLTVTWRAPGQLISVVFPRDTQGLYHWFLTCHALLSVKVFFLQNLLSLQSHCLQFMVFFLQQNEIQFSLKLSRSHRKRGFTCFLSQRESY